QWEGVRSLQETVAIRDAGSYFVLIEAAQPDRGVREGSIITLHTQSLAPTASAEVPGPGTALLLAALAVLAALRRR
ncbi:MAG TPA: hypothetical protein VFH47_05280, partial [Candidatus Thermoplasmatota archaeon]|nr:hypothetical protein [Candidatus Thermoplasmatota archaeon]